MFELHVLLISVLPLDETRYMPAQLFEQTLLLRLPFTQLYSSIPATDELVAKQSLTTKYTVVLPMYIAFG
jgi:hypothetical protein